MGEECSCSFGCCPHHGKRCVLIDESHFIATSREDWNLYHVHTVLGEEGLYGDYFHDFALIPESKATTKNIGNGWTLLGTIRPCVARLDLAPLVGPFLKNNSNFEYKYANHHAHINLAMETVTIDDGRYDFPKRNGKQQEHTCSVPVGNARRWEKPSKKGMPFYSRGNDTNKQQHQENDTLNK